MLFCRDEALPRLYHTKFYTDATCRQAGSLCPCFLRENWRDSLVRRLKLKDVPPGRLYTNIHIVYFLLNSSQALRPHALIKIALLSLTYPRQLLAGQHVQNPCCPEIIFNGNPSWVLFRNKTDTSGIFPQRILFDLR